MWEVRVRRLTIRQYNIYQKNGINDMIPQIRVIYPMDVQWTYTRTIPGTMTPLFNLCSAALKQILAHRNESSVQLLFFRGLFMVPRRNKVQHENKAAFHLAHPSLKYSEEVYEDHSTGL